jgi:hypothetical protein
MKFDLVKKKVHGKVVLVTRVASRFVYSHVIVFVNVCLLFLEPAGYCTVLSVLQASSYDFASSVVSYFSFFSMLIIISPLFFRYSACS